MYLLRVFLVFRGDTKQLLVLICAIFPFDLVLKKCFKHERYLCSLKRERYRNVKSFDRDCKVKRIIMYYLVDRKVFVRSFLFSAKKEIDRFGNTINYRYPAIHLFSMEFFVFIIKIFVVQQQLRHFSRRKDFIKI